MACKRSPVRSRYSPPLAQIRVTNTVDFKSKSTVFLCLSASKFIAILQILCKIDDKCESKYDQYTQLFSRLAKDIDALAKA